MRLLMIMVCAALGATAGCGLTAECEISTHVVRQTEKVIEIEWTVRNTSSDPIWIPTKWERKVNRGDGYPPDLPVGFVVWPDSLIFVAGQVASGGEDRDKVKENLRRQLYRPEKERVGRPESRAYEPGTAGVTFEDHSEVKYEALRPGEAHVYRAILPLPYRVQDVFKNPFAAEEKTPWNLAGFAFDGRDSVKETLPGKASRVWLGVCYYLCNPRYYTDAGKDPLGPNEQALRRMLITRSLLEGEQLEGENVGLGVMLTVTKRYTSSGTLDIAVPLRADRWQYQGPDWSEEKPATTGGDIPVFQDEGTNETPTNSKQPRIR